MQPIGKYIAVKPIDEEVKTNSGLLLSAKDVDDYRYKKGRIIKAGTEVNVIKADDIIYYDKNAGHTMLIDNESMTIIEERNVVVVI